MTTQPPPPPANSNNHDPYQHWLDDAAQMGLMLYRMRNDSKRERIFSKRHPHRSSSNEHKPSEGIMVPPTGATPRTSAALQTPTVATESSPFVTGFHPPLPRPQPFYHGPPLD